jgi:glycosyltransferase involved in cell wall biosynthesis
VTRRIRVLHVSKGLGVGGAEQLLVQLIGSQPNVRSTVAYFLPPLDHLVGELEEAGAEVVLVGSGAKPHRWSRVFGRFIADRTFDVVHYHNPLLVGLLPPVVRRASPQTVQVATEHSVWQNYHPATRIVHPLGSRLLDANICVSPQVEASLPSRLARKSTTIIHGIDVLRWASNTRRDIHPPMRLLTVANHRAEKDYPNLLRALAHLRDHHRLEFRLDSVGFGDLLAGHRRLAAELGLSDRVHFHGRVDDPQPLFAQADIFVLASKHEGLPVALMEAMASGLPIVATEAGGVPFALDNGRFGLLVPPEDSAALAAAIAQASQVEVHAKLADAARQRADLFDVATSAAKIETLYRTAICAARHT